MKVVVDKLPESKGDCKFAVCKNNYYRYNTETKEFRCILKEAYDVDTKCYGYNKADGCIHCDEIISFKDMYRSQMESQDCVVEINRDGYSCLIYGKERNDEGE